MSILLDTRFSVDGVEHRITCVDERPDMDLDPTLLLYKESEEEPIATVHLRDGRCGDPQHISVGRPYEYCNVSFMAGASCYLPKGHEMGHRAWEELGVQRYRDEDPVERMYREAFDDRT